MGELREWAVMVNGDRMYDVRAETAGDAANVGGDLWRLDENVPDSARSNGIWSVSIMRREARA